MSTLNVAVSEMDEQAKMTADASGAFRCPRCLGELERTPAALSCAACAADYPLRGGIVDFRVGRYDYYFNPVPREEMGRLIAQASEVPWDATVRHFLKHVKDVPEWLDNIVVNVRYAWKLLLELPPTGRFLDFGCGLGNMTHNIAPHVQEVVALDLTWERLEFARERFAKFNANDRITLVAGGDGRNLPFPDNHFDCIALSGVLEWIAADYEIVDSDSRPVKAMKMLMSFFGSTNPRKTQLRFMKELRRILKPGGQLFVAIENRWAYEYFTGFPDHHSGLSYNSLMPRFIANIYAIVRARQPYRTYTYSFNEFRHLFAAAGFPRHEFYGLSPGYSSVAEVIPAVTDQKFWSARRPATLKERIKRSRYFVPAFGVVASTQSRRPVSLLSRLLEQVSQGLPGAAEVEINECLISNKEKIVLKGSIGAERIVLKIPVDPRSAVGEDNNWRMLQALIQDPAIADLMPKPRARGVHQRLSYFVESAVAGRPLTSAITDIGRARAAGKIKELFLKMHAGRRTPAEVAAGTTAFDFFVERPVSQLRMAAFEPELCDALQTYLRNGIAEEPWSLGLYHGDFTSDNIFVLGDQISGVIDWEYATADGIAPLDVISYLESMQRSTNPLTTATTNLTRLASWDWPSSEEIDLLKSIYAHFRIAPERHEFLCRLSWMQHIGNILDTTARFDAAFKEYIRRSLAEVVRT